MSAPDWTELAACNGVHIDVFYPSDEGSGGEELWTTARRYCAGCPVARACLREALAEELTRPVRMRFGMRGGLTPDERFAMDGATRHGPRRSHCKNGHEMVGDNVYLHEGRPHCRACRVASRSAYLERKQMAS